MLVRFYSIFDNAAETFGPLFAATNDAAAVRIFTNEVNRAGSDNMLYLYPKDYELHYVLSFDNESGETQPVHPVNLINGDEVKRN